VSNFDWPCFRARKPRIYHLSDNISRRTGRNSSYRIQICTLNSNSLGLAISSHGHGAIAAAFLTTARDYTKQRWVLVMVVI